MPHELTLYKLRQYAFLADAYCAVHTVLSRWYVLLGKLGHHRMITT